MTNPHARPVIRGVPLAAVLLVLAGVPAWAADPITEAPGLESSAPAALSTDDVAGPGDATAQVVDPAADPFAEPANDAAPTFRSLDTEVQGLKKEVLDLNRDLFLLEEELLFPANTQVAVFLSMDVGTYFDLDSVQLRLGNQEVTNYLYTEREVEALNRGGVQRLWLGNLRVGEHELVAFFTGQGPHERDYKRGATLKFDKGVGAKYVELRISDRESKQQPEFVVREWE